MFDGTRHAVSNPALNFALLMQSLEKQLAQFNKLLEKAKVVVAEFTMTLGDALSEAEKSLAVVEASQDAIKRSCVQVASDHEASVKAVVEEFKAAGLVRTFSRTRSARFAHFRNLEVWCWDWRGSIFEG